MRKKLIYVTLTAMVVLGIGQIIRAGVNNAVDHKMSLR